MPGDNRTALNATAAENNSMHQRSVFYVPKDQRHGMAVEWAHR